MKNIALILKTLFVATLLVGLYSCEDDLQSLEDSAKKATLSDSTGTEVSTVVPLTGDQIRITPSLQNDTTQLITLTAETVNSYNCLNNNLISTHSFTGTSLSLGFTGVLIPASNYCTTGQKKATAVNYLYVPSNGTYAIQITLNGVTYSGSVIKSGSNYTFNWIYSSGVTISPLSL